MDSRTLAPLHLLAKLLTKVLGRASSYSTPPRLLHVLSMHFTALPLLWETTAESGFKSTSRGTQ